MPRISLAVVLVALLAGTLFAWTGCSCDETENDGDKSVTNVYVLPPVVVADDDDFFDDDDADDDTGDDDTRDDDTGDDDTGDDDTSDDDTGDDDTSDDDTGDDDTGDDDTGPDLTPPVCSAAPPEGNYEGPYAPLGVGPLTATITCTDPDSGGDVTIHYRTDGENPVIGDPETPTGASPLDLAIAQTTTVKFIAEDEAGNVTNIQARTWGVYLWEDFESYAIGATPGAPWHSITDPWNGTIPMVVELTDDPSGKYLQILDDNNSADGPHDTYGLLTREDPLPWPNEIGFQFDLALLAGNWIRLWTYAASGAIDFWQVVVEIKDGEVRGWDHVLYDWVFCAPAVVGEWYTFEIYFNHDTDRYSVMIDGAPSLCGDLRVLSVVPDLDEGLTVATLGDAGATGTLAFDNLRVFIPGGRRLNQ